MLSIFNKFSLSIRVRPQFGVQFVSIVVGLHGAFILISTLIAQLAIHRGSHLNESVFDLPLLIGLGLLYLSHLLWRHKHAAWVAAVLAYTFYIGLETSLQTVLSAHPADYLAASMPIRQLAVPILVMVLLYFLRKEFVVRSDIETFRSATRASALLVVAAFLYGVVGFLLLDTSDFHQEIGLTTAVHYTIDQFDLTTSNPLQLYTRRAHVFTDSLSVVSIGAVGYVLLSLFQPLKARFHDQAHERDRILDLLKRYPSKSEDFFKLWPRDKSYLFDQSGQSGVAFHVARGVSLCLGDPSGKTSTFSSLICEYSQVCYYNDWLPAFIHVQSTHKALYESHGFSLQMLGQEAVVDIDHFTTNVVSKKYFRQIKNRFDKQMFSCEMLMPPHHPALLHRLRTISGDWLSRGGRTERGFVMGYYSAEYMQQCPILVARDAAGTIQAFVNQVPAQFDSKEATFDILRQAHGAPGNINDYLLVNFIQVLATQGYARLNLGLCPLVGLDTSESTNNVIDGFLRFAYANGDRFYSFDGLRKFKMKFEPEWRDRYVAYKGGIRGFSRTMAALMTAMRVKKRHV